MHTEIPSPLPIPYAKSHGDVFDPQSDCTLALTRDISLRRVTGTYTENDRKLWVLLVHLAFNNLATQTTHKTNLRDIANLWRDIGGGRNGIQWLISSAESLRQCGINWTEGTKKGTATLLAGLEVDEATGEVSYDFGRFLTEKILDNKIFTRLRVHFMLGLSGKYAVALYTLLESMANLERPTITLSLEELRERLNVPENTYLAWIDFKKRVLDQPMSEINGAEDAPIMAQYKTESKGRKIVAVTFTVMKSEKRIEKESKIFPKVVQFDDMDKPKFTGTDYEDFHRIIQGTGEDIYSLVDKWWEWSKQKGEPIKNPPAAFRKWLGSFVLKGHTRNLSKSR
jgi:predicted transcriptional regulator YdeE